MFLSGLCDVSDGFGCDGARMGVQARDILEHRTRKRNSGNGVGDRLFCVGKVGKQSETVGNGLGTGVKED